MNVSNDKHLWVSWDEYYRAIEGLAALVHESGWKFDQVLCLARGGLRPGDIFSRIFDVPLAILSTSSYREEAGTQQGELNISKYITTTSGGLSGKVLLLDDLVDSGVTLEKVQHHLKENFPAVTEVRSAVIWCKACSALRPDYYLQYLPTNPWIHQPFEEYDSLRPNQLAAWIKKGKAD
ncbi:phosphoribosyltransferase [Noviherbaspirillum massiliense]|uniref:phosphoribosyltransferase n=1 Tax=Noviherbaspirillum massiliense TaxID=1465823 RepID=UPI0002D298EB|nr:phosphoribosyltransferase [Noviherbaspirillum massiliense]